MMQWRTMSTRRIFCSTLEPPTILYQSNHVLVVSKPPGWHSIPNQRVDSETKPADCFSSSPSKCLVTYLQSQGLGGGSRNDFLKPCHRIDQPCSGVSILAKTQKAASRIQSNWKDVQKTYLVVVEPQNYDGEQILETALSSRGNSDVNMQWQTLRAFMGNKYSRQNIPDGFKQSNKGWSVTYTPCASHDELNDMDGIQYEIRIRTITMFPNLLLEVRTRQGARHIVRGILSCHGIAVRGDLRYGASRPLPDQSVALHGRSITFAPKLQLGQTPFPLSHVAPIPKTWKDFFGFTEDTLGMDSDLHTHDHSACESDEDKACQ